MYSQVVTTELYPCHTYVTDSCFLVLLEWDLIDMMTNRKTTMLRTQVQST